MQENHSTAPTDDHGELEQPAVVAVFDAKAAIVQKGEELGNCLAAIAMLLKAADATRLDTLAEGGQYPLETVGYLVDVMATQVFNATDDLRMMR